MTITDSTQSGKMLPGDERDYLGTICYTGSGSGSGNPICVQRTVARDIKLIECIGKGRYGEVWKGKWFGEETVAVKTFHTSEEKSWENEVNIYLTQCLRDENILGFVAADNIDRGLYTELWIITDYHERGSLFDYLNNELLTPKKAFDMCFSIVKGLMHLHRAINGCKGKLALAHCDLKSKNILVKQNLTCCISDFGLALCGDADGNIQNCMEIRSGTKRYMAPEILNKTIDYSKIEAYQKADMYSLALVIWEMLRRCELTDTDLNTNSTNTLEYQPPFFDCVDLNPDENQMCTTVCNLKCRPTIPKQCKSTTSAIILELTRLIEELWADKADARLNALRVRKTLDKYNNSDFMS
jgi:TGF-beta receptor type-1